MQVTFRSTLRSIIGNIKKLFLPKMICRKKQVLWDPGYVDTVEACCMLHAMMQGTILMVFTVYVHIVNTYNQITM